MNIKINRETLCEVCDLISIGTSCGPGVKWIKKELPDWIFIEEEDGFILAIPPGSSMDQIKYLYITHIDEIGGIVTTERSNGFKCHIIGTYPSSFENIPLLSMDYMDESGASISPCMGKMINNELIVKGKNLKPFHSVFTFQEKAIIKNGWIEGKALDPRVTVYSIIEAAKQMNSTDTAIMIVFAEECSIFPAKKGAYFIQNNLPNLSLVVNCDVPGQENIIDGKLKECILRYKEGKKYIDPHFSLKMHERLIEKDCKVNLATSLTGSLTPHFIAQCHAISLAVLAKEAHVARTRVSISAIKDLIKILITIPELEDIL